MGVLDSWRIWHVCGLWARGVSPSIGYSRYPHRVLRHVGAGHDWCRCLAGTKAAVEMIPIVIAGVVLAASIAGIVEAASVDRRVNVTADPATSCSPTLFCPAPSIPSLIFRYDESAIEGDVVVWGCHGCRGEVMAGMPSWMRKVPTSYGYDLVGRPQPGVFRIKSFYDGTHKPSLDRIWTFIPR